ncbi:MAG: hypothetical protein K9G46_07015 [Flavobacteriales bacterium]|jgi:hypothetical protein|nr:hypothetical protein [Flavobacteriales bacterium]
MKPSKTPSPATIDKMADKMAQHAERISKTAATTQERAEAKEFAKGSLNELVNLKSPIGH